MNELEQLKRRVAELEKVIGALNASSTIPRDVDSAFRNRLGISKFQEKLVNSGVAVSTITQAVNEGGSSSYNVLAAPDYLLRMKYLNLTVGIPAYDF